MSDSRIQELLRELRDRWHVDLMAPPPRAVMQAMAESLPLAIQAGGLRDQIMERVPYSEAVDGKAVRLLAEVVRQQTILDAYHGMLCTEVGRFHDDVSEREILRSRTIASEATSVAGTYGFTLDWNVCRQHGWDEEQLTRVWLTISTIMRRESRHAAERQGKTAHCSRCEQWCKPEETERCPLCVNDDTEWAKRYTCIHHGALSVDAGAHSSCVDLSGCNCACSTCSGYP